MNKVYIFDTETREFLGEEDAFVDPVNGMDLCLPNGTFLPPLVDVPQGHSQVFQGGKWRMVHDFRGKRAFDCANRWFYTISSLGNLPDGHVIVDENVETLYREHPDHFVVTATSLSKRGEEEIDTIARENAKRHKRDTRNAILSSIDWKVFREEDAIRLNGLDRQDDEIHDLARYRQYLRDFTKQDSWWENPILPGRI